MSDDVQEHPQIRTPLPAQPAGGMIAIEMQRALAQVQTMAMIAASRPRNRELAQQRILDECKNPAFAERAAYDYVKGGSHITGPSIRMLEMMARHWGNVKYGFHIIHSTRSESECEAYAWDLETTVAPTVPFVVRHWRDTAKGGYALNNERDIYELIANMGARRKRACLEALIPVDIIDAAMTQCHDTLVKAIGGQLTAQRIDALVAKFAELGVTRPALKKFAQRELSALSVQQFFRLMRIYNSIREGMSEPSQWFEVLSSGFDAQATEQEQRSPPASTVDAAKEKLRRARKEDAPQTEKPSAPDDKAPQVTYAQLADRFLKATDIDVLDADSELIALIPSEQQRIELAAIYQRARADMIRRVNQGE